MFKEDSLCECFSFEADAIAPSLDGVLSAPQAYSLVPQNALPQQQLGELLRNPSSFMSSAV